MLRSLFACTTWTLAAYTCADTPAMSAAPIRKPDFPIRSAPLSGGPQLSGRDLYKQAVKDYLTKEIKKVKAENERVKEKNNEAVARHRLARHSEAQWDEASDRQWRMLPSVIRRRWDAESRRRWPRRGDDPTVSMDPVDVFCNSDEVYYVRGRKRRRQEHLDWSEEYIRERYEEAYNRLPQATPASSQLDNASNQSSRNLSGSYYSDPASSHDGAQPKAADAASSDSSSASSAFSASSGNIVNLTLLDREVFEFEARKIDTSRGFLSSEHDRFLDAHDNGYKADEPSRTQLRGDTQRLHQAIGDPASKGKWKWHKKLGEGTFGTARLYRYADDNDQTLARVVVKRDRGEPQDEERRHLKTLRDAGVDCKYIVKYLGETRLPGNLGCTYLEYAPYGTLHELYKDYEAYEMAIPEPFLWYLLRCLAEAVAVLDGENLFHFDIKPPNILLARADDSNTSHHWHQNYPTVLLADFGGVNEKSAKDEEHRGMGTPGFNPWELLRKPTQIKCNRYRTARGKPRPRRARDPSPKKQLPVDHKCGTHTSVWQIGQVILTGMRPFWPDSQLWDIPQPPWEAPDQPAPSDDQRKAYEYYCYQISRTDWPKRHPRRARNEQNHSMENVEALKEAFFPGKRDKDIETDPLFDALTLRAYDDASADTPLTSYRPSNAVDPHFSALRPQYSARLVECVFRCLEPLPADRPTVQDVLEEARDVCRADFERAWPGYPEMGSRQMGVGVEPDEYAPYRMRPVVPGPRPWRKGDEDDRNWKQLEAPMWLMIRRDKYPISKKVLNDKYKGE